MLNLCISKMKKILKLYGGDSSSILKQIKVYNVLAASGKQGPKLIEGDQQVPEGIYRLESLNPNSLYHLSLRTNYPNQFDKEKAKIDARENLGSDIMIHGKDLSIGCIAVGDEAIEELFILLKPTLYLQLALCMV